LKIQSREEKIFFLFPRIQFERSAIVIHLDYYKIQEYRMTAIKEIPEDEAAVATTFESLVRSLKSLSVD
jgi:hypothetical protein